MKITWRNEKRKVQDLIPAEYNPRKMDESQAKQLNESLDRFDLADPLIINADNKMIGGHQRLSILKLKGIEEVDVRVPNRQLTDKEERELNLRLNKNLGQWNFDQLVNFDEDMLKDVGFSQPELDYMFNLQDQKDIARVKLQAKFLAPPFSVLDARQEYWQARKRAWLELGIQSEIGRGENLLHFSDTVLNAQNNSKAKVFGTAGNISEATGTSIFDPVLCELIYRWFMPIPGGSILDPFAGGSVRAIVASECGYDYTGIDLRKEQIDANIAQAEKICKNHLPNYIVGDSASCIASIPSADFDFIFSCPPYGDLEVYSDDPKDLSKMTHDQFIEAYRKIIAEACKRLKQDRFAAVCVGDFRDPQGFYRNFISETIEAFLDGGMMLYNEAILITAIGSLAMRAGRVFQSGRKLGKAHQNVLVFYKGDPKSIKEDFGLLDFSGMDQAANTSL